MGGRRRLIRSLRRRPVGVLRRGAVGLLCVGLVACTAQVRGHGTAQPVPPTSTIPTTASSSPASPTPSRTTSKSASTSPPAGCSTTYRLPDPNRPRVALRFVVEPGLSTVHGTEHVTFTPDLPITELIFRLTANTGPTVAQGNRIVVSSAKADHGGRAFTFTRSGADRSTQGGLLHIPFAARVPAGTTITADISFTVTLGAQSFDRFGRTTHDGRRFAWFASAQPLLAWERGYGWHAEDLIQFTAESATSEAMNTDLTVTAPAGNTVIMSGDPLGPLVGPNTWHANIAAARDVSVAVGPFSVVDTVVSGVRLRVGAYNSQVRDALVPEFRRAIVELSRRFGPFPFPSLSVARVPSEGGGIEYPSSILMLDGSRLVAVHETAHQWFYAMVGDSQALHPWLDEAFAEYAEQLVDDDREPPGSLDVPGAVDRSTESYGTNENSYYFITYSKGAAALHAARAAAGASAWDAALRCYVAANAWGIADPKDFEAAISKFPRAVAVLRKAGALP